MRFRLLISLAVTAGLLAAPAASHAVSTRLKVRTCVAGKNPKERQATFYARMRAIPGTARMQMRFTLLDRSDSGNTTAIRSPQLARWRRSRPGVRTFGYAQTVSGLQRGGTYAMAVEYRWVNAVGKTLRTLRRTSADCRQDGELPNLSVVGVSTEPSAAEGTETYNIEIANRGTAPAREFDVELFVDSAAADSAHIHEVLAGETVTISITGPTCLARLRAAIDRADDVNETTEDDNTLRSSCPGRL